MYGSKELKSLLLKEKGGLCWALQGVAEGGEGVVFAKVGGKGEGGLQAAYGVLGCGEGRWEMPPEVDGCELGVGCACFFAG